MKNLGLIPLRNFAVLDEKHGLYRSAQPLYNSDYRFLKEKIGIDVIINLRSELRHDSKFDGFTVINFDIKDHELPTLEQCKKFQQMIKEWCIEGNLKILIHCKHGHGRTSMFSVLARLAMGWSLKRALKEEEEKFHYSFRHPKQKEFLIKNFNK